MKKKLSLLLVGLIVLSLVGCAGGKKSDNKNTIKLGYLSITHALPLYVLDQKEKANVELVKFSSWPDLMDALDSGKIDGASVLIELAMQAKSKGIDLKAVALGHRDGNVVVVKNDIDNVSDLKGKKFAVPSKLSTHYILTSEMLKSDGLSIKDVNIVELSPAEMPVALQEGRISGYCVAEPFGAKSVVNKVGKVLKESSDIMEDSICCGLVLRGDFIKNKNKEAEELVNKYSKAASYIEKNGGEEEAEKFLSVDKDTLKLSLKWISYDKLKIEEKDYDELSGKLKELGLLKDVPSYDDFVDSSLIDKVESNEES